MPTTPFPAPDDLPDPPPAAVPAVTGVGRPLEGVRVLSLEQFAALPYAARHLSDLGAEVIRVVAPGKPPGLLDTAELLRGKRIVALDLARPDGPEVFRRLARACDVVAHNFTNRVVRKYGIDHDSLAPSHPGLVYVSVTGFGTTGPWAPRPLFGPGAEAAAGHSLLIGDADGWPGRPGTLTYADNTCGLFALLAVLAALETRDRTGRGAHIDVSLYETSAAVLGPVFAERGLGAEPGRIGNDDRRFAVHAVLATTGHDRAVAVAAREEQVGVVRDVLGAGGTDEADLAAAAAGWRAEDLAAALQAAGVAASVVADAADVLTDPQLRHREWFGSLPGGPDGDRLDVAGPAWGRGADVPMEAPHAVGADNRSVLRDVGGFTEEEIEALHASGTVAEPGHPPRVEADAATRVARGALSRVDDDARDRLRAARAGAGAGGRA